MVGKINEYNRYHYQQQADRNLPLSEKEVLCQKYHLLGFTSNSNAITFQFFRCIFMFGGFCVRVLD